MKLLGRIGLTGVLAFFYGSVWAQNAMSCERAGTLVDRSTRKIHVANAIEIQTIPADA